jgi:hypothetical protein
MLRKYMNGQRGTFCIKKIIQSNNFFTQGKNKKYMWGPREYQNGNPSQGFPLSCPSCGLYKILGGMTSFPTEDQGSI